ncbi:hypothetical protein NIES4106_58190 (plasmid) [Fischerella sp. NIES-4106]|nr:hypothetical protein NIES4106_58190 [Fischerella sp. NIES-4106]
MQTTLQVNFSDRVSEVLSCYCEWQQVVNDAINKLPFEENYCPTVVEIFDQYGLLFGGVCDSYSYETTRNTQDKSDFLAWFLDGELAVFYVDSEIVVNRLQFLPFVQIES